MSPYLKAFYNTILAILPFFFTVSTFGQTPSTSQNYIITTTVKKAGKKTAASLDGLPVDSLNKTIQYFDGLGRPLQTVQWKASPGKRDVVTPVLYDSRGREAKKYLPYVASLATSTGNFKTTGLTDQTAFYNNPSSNGAAGVTTISNSAFAETKFEASPLNRVLEQGAPGAVWQPAGSRTSSAGRTRVISYSTNNTNTGYTTTGYAVRIYTATAVTTAGHEHERTLAGTGTYAANLLYLTITKDENWVSSDGKAGTIEEYKNKEDKVLVKRLFNKLPSGSIQTLSTFYVYDDLGNLSFVLPPGIDPDATLTSAITQTMLDNFCYQYRYDGRGRVIEKKVPGKGWENMIYNRLDQLVFHQDARQQTETIAGFTPGQYHTFNKYDALGRLILSGVERNRVLTRAQIQELLEVQVNNWENRSTATGNMHGYTNQSMPGNAVDMDVHIVNYYDDYTAPGIPNNQSSSYTVKTKGLLTATKTKVLGTSNYLWTINYYDDEGRVVKVWKQHYKGGTVATNSYDEISNVYNFQGMLTSTVRKHYIAGVESLYTKNDYTYDHAGRKVDTYQKTGNSSSTSANSSVLLSRNVYNEVGQLTKKSYHSTNSGSSFAESVNYTYNARGWMSSQTATPLAFNQVLKYNEAVTGATPQYNGNISRQEWGTNYYNYIYDRVNRLTSAVSNAGNNELLSYSTMGNIDWLQRKLNGTLIDQMKYNLDGNKLTSVMDTNANVADLRFQLSGTTAYNYDVNGNMISRINTTSTANNMYDMTYNYMNLPTNINANGAVVTYTYDGKGNKLKKSVTGSATVNSEYINGVNYEGGVFAFSQTETGRVTKNGTGTDPAYLYEYTLTDHLGNGRVYFDISGGVARKIQETEYYAFGLPINVGSLIGGENKFQYNGKEKQDQEKMYDYGARFYDPIIARWNVMDPLAEKSFSLSPYRYGFNNPVRFLDRDGAYETDGHFWTVYLMGVLMGRNDAFRIAYNAEAPDNIMNRAGDIMSSPATWMNRNSQLSVHALNGLNSASTRNMGAWAVGHAKSYGELGEALHYLGDSYAHSMISNENIMYPNGLGHAFSGHRPDKISLRPGLYNSYVNSLANVMGDRLGFKGKVDTFTFDYIGKSGGSTEQNSAILETEIRLREGVGSFSMDGDQVNAINDYISNRDDHFGTNTNYTVVSTTVTSFKRNGSGEWYSENRTKTFVNFN